MTAGRPLRVHVVPIEYDQWRVPIFVAPLAGVLPWLGEPTGYQRSIAGDWVHAAGQWVEPVPLEASDVAVLAVDLEACRDDEGLHARTVRLAAEVAAAGKVMLVFCQGDREFAAPGENCVVFRTSSTRKSLGPRDVVMPAWVADPAERIDLDVRPWSSVPSVNFVGFAYPLGVDFGGPLPTAVKWANAAARGLLTAAGLDRLLIGRDKRPLPMQRIAALAALRAAHGVETDIELRATMVRLEIAGVDEEEQHRGYLRRIAGSDYTLSVRGEGNYSYRGYESLAVGRPVVSVRTKDVRPCVRDVPWDRVSIDVPFGRLPRMGAEVRRGHLARRDDWLEVQQLCRQSWVEWLSAPGFFRRLAGRTVQLADQQSLTPEAIAAALA